jgi:hypothetical protein
MTKMRESGVGQPPPSPAAAAAAGEAGDADHPAFTCAA